jgi:predicted membrane-bound spermidine synthase
MGRYDPPDPLCRHVAKVRVASHVDLVAANTAGDPIASTECCDRQPCIDDATEWVRAVTHAHDVVVVPLRRPR